jgi:hypothetical protein
LLAASAALLGAPGAATAATGYGAASGSTPSQGSGSSLPFTGQDLGIVAGSGLGLLGLGLALRFGARRRETD